MKRKRVLTGSLYGRISRKKGSDDFFERLSTPTQNYYFNANIGSKAVIEAKKFDKRVMTSSPSKYSSRTKYQRLHEDSHLRCYKEQISEICTGKKNFNNHNENYFKDQLKIELKIAKKIMRNKKVWKFNHVSFMANIDRVINSVPLIKK